MALLPLCLFADTKILLENLNKDVNIKNMDISLESQAYMKRSDVVVIIDKLLHRSNDKHVQSYVNPFQDVSKSDSYWPSLVKLAYFESKNFKTNPINRNNRYFNPDRFVTREEFYKIILTSFDIEKKPFDLNNSFRDIHHMSPWAKKYFETAAYHDLIYKYNNTLNARAYITMHEALVILSRVINIK